MRCWFAVLMLIGLAPAALARTVTITLHDRGAHQVALWGSFDGWRQGHTMTRGPAGMWKATLSLPAGRYEYAFLVDGRWTFDAHHPNLQDGLSGRNNVVWVAGRAVSR